VVRRRHRPQTGLTPDRWPTRSFCSIAAVGFALSCWPVGVERGWMSRTEARERTLTTVRYFQELPQGPDERAWRATRASSTTSSTWRRGCGSAAPSCRPWTRQSAGRRHAVRRPLLRPRHAEEREIRDRVQAIYERIEWPWAVVRPNRITMGWHPDTGFIPSDWYVYNEGMLILLLAMGSPTHPVDARGLGRVGDQLRPQLR
jgi:hypothetical protein